MVVAIPPGWTLTQLTRDDASQGEWKEWGKRLVVLLILLGFMLAAAAIGGLATYKEINTRNIVRRESEQPQKDVKSVPDKKDKSWLLCFIEAFIATALVPLFLRTISSDVLEKSAKDPGQMLVFFSYCLIAALTSRPFTDVVLKKAATGFRQPTDAGTQYREALGEPEERVLGVLNTARAYEAQEIAGLLGPGEPDILQTLAELVRKGLATRIDVAPGAVRWSITPLGRLRPST